MGLNDLRFGIKMEVPDLFEQHCSGYHAVRIAHEIFKQSELPRPKLDIPVAALRAARD
jgi:hypothetical protein